jgi:uncharacterized repeat protein (TIGR01451 family)
MLLMALLAAFLDHGVAISAYIKRFSTVANGAVTYTGNTLGLSKQSSANAPGNQGSIGTFITTDTFTRDNTYPFGTTSNWLQNGSTALLTIPPGSTILYAELIWGGSYNYGGQNVSANLATFVTFATPSGSSSVNPSATTAVTLTGDNYYVRSAEVTSMVKSGGTGLYTTSHVPGTEATSENSANAAGWTLAVIYSNPSLPARNMTIFVGGELTSSTTTTTSSVSGFCTPGKGPINARLMVSAMEGDSNLTGDQMQFGPTTGTLTAISGPNNPLTNFFCSQINGNSGTLDTSGSFGTSNHPPGTNDSGKRQGWDITNVDISARLQNSQTTAVARGTTSGDRYIISSIGLQIEVGAPVFPTAVLTVDKTKTYVGDTLTYTVTLDNSTGTADALNVVYTNTPPLGTSFVSGSVILAGVSQPASNPVAGIQVGTVAAGAKTVISYRMLVNALPISPAPAQYSNFASWTYQYQSCPLLPLNNGTITTSPAIIVTVPRLEPTKSAAPSGAVLPGGTVVYTISIPNTGTVASSETTLADPIPVGTTYIPNSTKMNGVSIPDISGKMPFMTTALVAGPGAPAGQIGVGTVATISFSVTIDPNPPLIITNIATIDPDGPGPVAAITVPLTNPPVQADLGVTISDDVTSVTAGTASIYNVKVTNNGPDPIISFILSLTLPPEFTAPILTPSAGIFTSSTGNWTGLNIANGQSVNLSIAGTVSPSAIDSITVRATVAAPPGVNDFNIANNWASDTDTLLYSADLAVIKSDGQTNANQGTSVTYTITVTNNGPSTVTSLTVIDTLPIQLLNPVFTSSHGTYNADTGGWNGVSIGPSQNAVLTLKGTVDPSGSGNMINLVTVAPPPEVTDPVPGNNSSTDTDTIGSTVSLSKSVAPTSTVARAPVTYTLTISNSGTVPAQLTQLKDTLPDGFSYISGSCSGGTVSDPVVSGQILTWNGAWAIPSSGTFALAFRASPGTTLGIFYNNASISGGNFPTTVTGNTAPVTVASPLLTLEKQVDKTTANPGTELIFSVYYRNIQNSPALNVIITDTIPAFTSFVPGSLRIGAANSTFTTAGAPLTDGADSDMGEISGINVIFRIDRVESNDGITGSGPDEGRVFFKVVVQ